MKPRRLVSRLNAWMKRDAYRLGWNDALAVVRDRARIISENRETPRLTGAPDAHR